MSDKTQSILIGGAAAGLATVFFGLVPAVGQCLGGLAIIGGGVLAVWRYTNTNQLTITGGEGAEMGALAGIVTLVVASLLGVMIMLTGLTPSLSESIDVALEEMETRMVDQGTDPEQIDNFMETVENIVDSPLLIPGLLLCGLVLYVIAGTIGGAIGASVFKKGSATQGEASEGS